MISRYFRSTVAFILSLSMVALSPGLPCYAAVAALFPAEGPDASAPKVNATRPRFTVLGGGFNSNRRPPSILEIGGIDPHAPGELVIEERPVLPGAATPLVTAITALVFSKRPPKKTGSASQRDAKTAARDGSLDRQLDADQTSDGLGLMGKSAGMRRRSNGLTKVRGKATPLGERLDSDVERLSRIMDDDRRQRQMAWMFERLAQAKEGASSLPVDNASAAVAAPDGTLPANNTVLRPSAEIFRAPQDVVPEVAGKSISETQDSATASTPRTVPFADAATNLYGSARGHWLWIQGLLKIVAETGVNIRKKLAVASGLALATTALSSATVYLYSRIAAHMPALALTAAHSALSWRQAFFTDGGLRGFAGSALAMVSVYIVMSLCRFHFVKTTHEIGNQLTHALFQKVAKHAISLPLRWHREHPPGDLLAVSDGALERLQSVFTNAIIKPVNNGVLASVALGGILLLCGWHMTLILLPFFILPAIPSMVYQRSLNRAFSKLYCEGKPSLMRKFSAILGNLKHIKAAGMEGHAAESIDEASRQAHLAMGDGVVKALAPFMAFKDLAMNLANFGALAVVVLASFFHYAGMDIWRGFGVLMLAGNLGHVIQEVCSGFMDLAQGNGVTGQLQKILAEAPEKHNSKGIILPPARGGREIRLRGLKFGYKKGRYVLRIDDLRIDRGEMTAIVGPSGSGKSSLIALIAGLERPSRGAILVDGIDRRNLAEGQFRGDLVFIPHEVEPFDDSIFNNIASANPNASRKDVWNAAKKAGLHEEIRRLGGYGVKVGQNGVNLSSGQKKRLALARLWLRRADGSPPPVIILDEPTTSLDAASAQRVLDALESFRGQSTVIVTTHDPTVASKADRIVLLENGQVAESSASSALGARNGSQAGLWEEPKQ